MLRLSDWGGVEPSVPGQLNSILLQFPLVLLSSLRMSKGNVSKDNVHGHLPGFQAGLAEPQGGGGLVPQAVPARMRGRWVPAVPVLPSLPPAARPLLPARPVLGPAPGKEMEKLSGAASKSS